MSNLISCKITELGNDFVEVDFKDLNSVVGKEDYSIVSLYETHFFDMSVIVKSDISGEEKDRSKINFEVMLEFNVKNQYIQCGHFNTHWEHTDKHLGECANKLIWEKIYKLLDEVNTKKDA